MRSPPKIAAAANASEAPPAGTGARIDEPDRARAIGEALRLLGVERFAFGIHDSAFPAGEADAGHGSPASEAGERLVEFLARLGFNALQLGPAGQISDVNPSPYDATVFARNVLRLDLATLCEEPFGALLERQELDAALSTSRAAPARADPTHARRLIAPLLDRAHARFVALSASEPGHPLVSALGHFVERNAAWLELDALFEVMAERLGHGDPGRFEPAVQALFEDSPAGAQRRRSLRAVMNDALQRVEVAQLLVELQAVAFRGRARARGISVLGDMQVGWSVRDRFLRRNAFARGWLVGAPPSRTNPDGQPWGYPLLDPDQLEDAESPARRLLSSRLRHEFQSHDGLRIDHPHGLVCPWIYRADAGDPLAAVRAGRRAFDSPDADDADLQRWAIARGGDLDHGAGNRWSDGWVRSLEEAQVARYARLVDAVIDIAREHGHAAGDIAVEVLSTCPTPLSRVLERHGLGRFRVTQKADPDDPADVYRTDRARPADWVMLGNHDTPPIFAVADGWLQNGGARGRARYLAERLIAEPDRRAAAAEGFCASAGALAQAHLADLFLSDARNVFVYFTDLFGERIPFNRAGVVHPDNWSLRIGPDFEREHAERVRSGRALDPAGALALALGARGLRPDLAAALRSRA